MLLAGGRWQSGEDQLEKETGSDNADSGIDLVEATRERLERHIGDEANADAMGQFGKLSSIDDLPPDAELDALIRQAADLAKSAPAPRKVKHEPKAAPDLHPDFAKALAAAPKAKEVLDGFPPSAQRDYLEWVSDAKQDATRQKRIATAIEWLSEGKRRHWKYANC